MHSTGPARRAGGVLLALTLASCGTSGGPAGKTAPSTSDPSTTADTQPTHHTDPAFAAHVEPISKWAQAVWYSWVPTRLLDPMVARARAKLTAAAIARSVLFWVHTT